MKTFREAYEEAPCEIWVTKSKSLRGGAVDAKYLDSPPGRDYMVGRGTKQSPFQYKGSSGSSPYCTIINLWFQWRETGGWIEVNSWKFRIIMSGVETEDGRFTKLT